MEMGALAAKRAGLIAIGVLTGLAVSGCSMYGVRPGPPRVNAAAAVNAFAAPSAPNPALSAMDGLILKYSAEYKVPEKLIRRIIVRESNYNAAARHGPYLGLMQIRHDTARGMGYTGSPGGLLEAETNLRYAVKYLAGAYVTAGGNEDMAVHYYASGYYYDAKRKGLLEEAGLR